MKEKFINLVRDFDAFSSQVTFTLNKNRKFSSLQSGILSLIFYFLSIAYFFYQLPIWVNSKNNDFISQTILNEYPILNFRETPDFMLAICLSNNDNATVRDKDVMDSLNITVSWTFFMRNPWLIQNISIPIPSQTCTPSDIPDKMKLKFNYGFYHHCTCVNYSSLHPYNMSFFFTDTYSAYLWTNVSWKDSVLKNEAEYNYYYKSLKKLNPRVITYYTDYLADLHGLDFSLFFNYHITYLNPDIIYVTDMFFNSVQMSVDKGFVGTDYNNFTGISYDKSNSWFLMTDNPQNFATKNTYLAGYRFKASNKKIVHQISVLKIDFFIGKVTSFLTFIFALLYVFNKFINSFLLKSELIRLLFKNRELNLMMMSKFKERNKNISVHVVGQKHTNVPSTSQKNDLTNKNSKSSIKNFEEVEIIVDEKQEIGENNNNEPDEMEKNEKIEDIAKRKKSSNTSFKDHGTISLVKYIFISCYKRGSENALNNFKNGKEYLDFYLDGVIYFKRMLEFDIIKFIIFNRKERSLINLISNPDFTTLNSEFANNVIMNEYDDRFVEEKYEKILKECLPQEIINRNNAFSSAGKISKIIENGNQVIYDPIPKN